MKILCLVLSYFFLFQSVAVGANHYRCTLVGMDSASGAYQVDESQHVDLILAPELVATRIHINSASEDLTFSHCLKTLADGSNFAGWFEYECRELQRLDGGSFSIDVFLSGAYAGISPPVTPAYQMFAPLASVSEKLGLQTPVRTFVIYAEGKPQYEFFCYEMNAGIN